MPGEFDPHNQVGLLELWMEQYGTDVTNFAFSYVKNYHQAQDIAQDVFLRAFLKSDSFRGESTVKTWLLSITANRCRDFLRSWHARHEVYELEDEIPRAGPDNTERAVLERLEQDKVWKVVFDLPLKYREVLVLFYFRDLSTKEISETLGVSDEAVRTRLHRGRLLVKERLESEPHEELT